MNMQNECLIIYENKHEQTQNIRKAKQTPIGDNVDGACHR